MSTARSAKKGFSGLLVVCSIATAAVGCSMDPKECAKLREQAYELINVPNYCSDQVPCKVTEWPGCPKPVNQTNFDKIHAMMLRCREGKCEERPVKCDPPPPVYCQEGLCTLKYKAMPAAPTPVQTPGGEIKFE